MNDAESILYVSCDDTHEIVHYSVNAATGALVRRGSTVLPAGEALAGSGGAPLAVSPAGFVYAALRTHPFRVVSYRMDQATGALARLSEATIPEGTVYIQPDPSGRFLLGAAYYAECVWVSRIEEDGRIVSPPVEFAGQLTHAHCVLAHPNGRVVYAAATAIDEVLRFTFDAHTARLEPQFGSAPDQASEATPRHLALHPSEDFLYCMNEATGTIDGFHVDRTTGALARFQRADARPADARTAPAYGADLHITPDGRFLYGSERGRGTITAYAIDAISGLLSPVQTIASESWPRSFAIDPVGRFLVVAGQGSRRIKTYAIDSRGGALTELASSDVEGRPVWVEIIAPTV